MNFRQKIKVFVDKKCTEKSWAAAGVCFGAALVLCAAVYICGCLPFVSEKAEFWGLRKNWYGEVYRTEAAAADETKIWGNVVLSPIGYNRLEAAYVLVNGEPVRNFADGETTVRVEQGDVLAVDLTAYRRPITVRVDRASSVIDTGRLREQVTAKGGVAEIGEIRLR